MNTITSIFIRPSTDTVWFFEHEISDGNAFYQNYIKEKLIDTNLLKQSRSYSDDGLVMTTVNELTEEGFNIWFNDPIIITARDEMLVYNTQNNIVLNSIEIT